MLTRLLRQHGLVAKLDMAKCCACITESTPKSFYSSCHGCQEKGVWKRESVFLVASRTLESEDAPDGVEADPIRRHRKQLPSRIKIGEPFCRNFPIFELPKEADNPEKPDLAVTFTLPCVLTTQRFENTRAKLDGAQLHRW